MPQANQTEQATPRRREKAREKGQVARSRDLIVASALAQGGLVFAPTSLLPSASRISPAAKLGQLFSITALRGLIKSLLPATVVAYLAVGCLRRDWNRSYDAPRA